MKNDFKIIYILGAGHSGSSLLDNIIGSSKEVFSVGELFYYDIYLNNKKGKKLIKNKICTCGKKIDDCDFWKNIKKKDLSVNKNEDLISSIKIMINIINLFEKLFCFNMEFPNNYTIYDSIFKEAKKKKEDIKYILDSSKDPRRLYELIKDKSIDNQNIQIIHLVRDGRAYINSFQDKKRTNLKLKKKNMLICIFEWILINLISKILIHKYKLKNINISYEKFTKNPIDTIEEINNKFEISVNKNFLNYVNKTTYHNINGNVTRFNNLSKIVLNQKWKKNLNFFKKIISTVMLFPFNYIWVYKK